MEFRITNQSRERCDLFVAETEMISAKFSWAGYLFPEAGDDASISS